VIGGVGTSNFSFLERQTNLTCPSAGGLLVSAASVDSKGACIISSTLPVLESLPHLRSLLIKLLSVHIYLDEYGNYLGTTDARRFARDYLFFSSNR